MLVERLRRSRLSFAVVAMVALAACDATQTVSPKVAAGSKSGFGPTGKVFDHSDKFGAAYSGTYNKSGDCSATAMFTYDGSGHARFVRFSNEQIKLTWFCGSEDVTGSATLTSARAPRDSITASLSSKDFKGACYGFTLSFTVTGGTGRFRHASGGGTIVLNVPSARCVGYYYSDRWRGTLKF